MADAAPSPTHFKLKVRASAHVAGIQFDPGTNYTVKAAVFAQLPEGLAVDVVPIIKE